MQELGNTLFGAAAASTQRLEEAGRVVAAERPGRANGLATARVARESIFTEAMLGAMHARFNALKEVAK